jgi:hypothetical protein
MKSPLKIEVKVPRYTILGFNVNGKFWALAFFQYNLHTLQVYMRTVTSHNQ